MRNSGLEFFVMDTFAGWFANLGWAALVGGGIFGLYKIVKSNRKEK